MVVGSSAWFALVAWVDRIMGFGVHLPKASLRRLQVSNAGDFFFQFWGYRSISDFILLKTSFPGFAILSDVASRKMLYLANDIDEPRLRLARLLPCRRRDSRGRWLWRLVRLSFLG